MSNEIIAAIILGASTIIGGALAGNYSFKNVKINTVSLILVGCGIAGAIYFFQAGNDGSSPIVQPTNAQSSIPSQSTNQNSAKTIIHQGKLKVSVVDKDGIPQSLSEIYVSPWKDSRDKWEADACPGPEEVSFEIKPAKKLSINASICLTKNRWLADKWHLDNEGEPLVQEDYRIVVNGIQLGPNDVVIQSERTANFVAPLVFK